MPVLLTILGILASVIGVAARIFFFRGGIDKERRKNAEQELEDIDAGKEIDNDVAAMPDGAALDELHNDWSKK